MAKKIGPGIGLAYGWDAGELNWNEDMNANLLRLDSVAAPDVIDTHDEPPVGYTPTQGDMFLVGAGAKNAWADKVNHLAAWVEGAWIFVPPKRGLRIAARWSSNPFWWFNGDAWEAEPGGDGGYSSSDLKVVGGITNTPQSTTPSTGIVLDDQSKHILIPELALFGTGDWTILLRSRDITPGSAPEDTGFGTYYPVMSMGEGQTTWNTYRELGAPVAFGSGISKFTSEGVPDSTKKDSNWGILVDREGRDWMGFSCQSNSHTDGNKSFTLFSYRQQTDGYVRETAVQSKKWNTPEAGRPAFAGGLAIGSRLVSGVPTADTGFSNQKGGYLLFLDVVIYDRRLARDVQERILRGEIAPDSQPGCRAWYSAQDAIGNTIKSKIVGVNDATIVGSPSLRETTPYEAWLVGPAPTGDWSGHAKTLAESKDGGWSFTPLSPGASFISATDRRFVHAEAPTASDSGTVELVLGSPVDAPRNNRPYVLQGGAWKDLDSVYTEELDRDFYVIGGQLTEPPSSTSAQRYALLDGATQYMKVESIPGVPETSASVSIVATVALDSFDSVGDTEKKPMLFSSEGGHYQFRVGAGETAGAKRLVNYVSHSGGVSSGGGTNNYTMSDLVLGRKYTVGCSSPVSIGNSKYPLSYLDGVQGQTGTALTTSTLWQEFKGPFYIGVSGHTPKKRYWNGKVFDLRVYNRILTAQEHKDIADGVLDPDSINGLAAKWVMDSVYESGGFLRNLVTGELDLEMVGAPVLKVENFYRNYLVGEGATGEWEGQDGMLATMKGGVWVFRRPTDGVHFFNASTRQTWVARDADGGIVYDIDGV
ncbi:DUF2793 domain-containing protein [Alcaligenes faecalis]|uniref:DUF2793 domain-containing protein n=1 Tax=Alcaligenes faecalis TaxID=511 RepID=UPI00068CFC1B|nr:DUF2793 domain-containing protein [Alcaligenes faecalis]